jgi:two-component system, LuxR family, sensor kinase FixL
MLPRGRRSEIYFRSLIENALDLIALLDADGTIRYVSPSHEPVLGYRPEELVGTQVFDLVHPDDRQQLRDAFAEALRTAGVPHTVEFRFRHRDGSWRVIAARGTSLLHDPVVASVVVNSRDVTARRRAEQEARQRQAELAHMLRVQTIDEMAAGLAHEINQPLSAIVSYASGAVRRLQTGSADPPTLLAVMEEITVQARRADEIVRRLRRFVRKQEPRTEPVNVNDLVREVAGLVDDDVRMHGVGLRLQLAAVPPVVQGDAVQLEQVILNLVRNGLEAMAQCRDGDRRLSICTSCAADAVEVAVADTGDGVAPSVAEKMFDPFFTTKPGGLGMGLAISRSIVEAHGGRLWATPGPGRGVTFRFRVPLRPAGEGDVA